MRSKIILAAGLSLLLVAACEKAGDPEVEPPIPPAEDSATEGDSGAAAQDALGRASESARETMESLGEAGRAGFEALQENAPEIREGLNEAGDRLRDAAGALTGDNSDAPPLDAEGDSERDVNETPEAQEPTAR